MDLKASPRFSWCEVHEVEVGSGVFWELGPLRLWAHRGSREWSVSFERGDGALSDHVSVQLPSNVEPGGEATTVRFGFQDAPAKIRLAPAPAKRPVVVTPDEPFSLPPNEETTLYVSTPVWVGVEVGEPPVQLLEEPSHRPSDTWFGESTRDGDLCYATRTRATLDVEQLPIRSHRVLSVVRIRNRASTVLEIERIKLPTPYMSLFADTSGQLWTEELSLDREQNDEVAAVVLGTRPPAVAADAERLVGPRKKRDRGFLDRTFSGLMRELRG
jgi:hypothetical protein